MDILLVSENAINRAIRVLHDGGVVAHATETCYGLTCDLKNPKAVEQLFRVKKRPVHQPVSVLFSSLKEAEQFVVFSKKAFELAKKHLPGPLTLVLPLRSDAPFSMYVCPPSLPVRQAGQTPIPNPTIGIRISSSPLAEQLAASFGSPIATTSANLHGQPNTYSAQDIIGQYASEELQPDLLLDSGPIPIHPASTVVEVIGERVNVLRQGDVHC
ncbi:threonylcarbamoyl-AMP synthase [Candidatus Peribacteria bacterium]|nr:threonylcarbamoyl-AMP synthase [Candidatus Peribacteria bacterium]